MYFIKKITFDPKKNYQVSKIINHTNKTISVALKLLESSVREYVYDECGRDASTQTLITDIDKIESVIEPMLDGIVLYRLESDMFRIFVYQKKTIATKGWIGAKISSTFFLTNIFELEEYANPIESSNNSINTQIKSDTLAPIGEMVAVGPAKVKIPISMTVAPMSNLIEELKKSSKFKSRLEAISKISEEESKIPQIEFIAPTIVTILTPSNESISEPTNELTNEPTNESTNEPTNESTNEPTNESINIS